MSGDHGSPQIVVRDPEGQGRLWERVEAVVEESDEWDSRSEVVREGVRRLVTEHEVRQRLDESDCEIDAEQLLSEGEHGE